MFENPSPTHGKKKQSAPLTRLGMKSSLLGQTCAHWLLPRLLGGEHPMAHDIVEKTMGDRFRPVRIGLWDLFQMTYSPKN